MLQELRIQNLAIIDKLEIDFSNGLNVLTGETGAGKSIIVDALELVLGGRASAELIRTGADEAVVGAGFDIEGNKAIADLMSGFGIDNDDTRIIIKRIISHTGKNRIYINNSLTNLSTLSAIGDELVDIHGQHEHQSLLKIDKHIDMLDAFGSAGFDKKIYELRRAVEDYYNRLKTLKERLLELENKEKDRVKEEEFLRYQIREIEEASLKPKEDEDLLSKKRVGANAGKLATLSNSAYEGLYESDAAVIKELNKALTAIREIGRLDSRAEEPARLCESAIAQLEEAAGFLRDYSQKIEFDSDEFIKIDDRLDLINRLKKKYGSTIEDILLSLEEAKKRLQAMEKLDEDIGDIKAGIDKAKKDVSVLAMELSRKREKVARDIEKKVEAELSDLNMKKTRFAVKMWKESGSDTVDGFSLTAKGIDRVEFLIAPNVGEEPKPLAKIASGGELSRIMLALKAILAEADDVPTLVFDEVDAGIGGGVAEVVGERLKRIAKGHQVFCITHLPQIAGYADSHYFVEKKAEGSRTITKVVKLKEDGRVKELARMLGGKKITETTLKHAEEMLRQ
ncbi:MAG: DNA repair protein RecN [Nitrospirae bacterium]|nr:DNA repair protein RecN [Nitrospirota bacterium]